MDNNAEDQSHRESGVERVSRAADLHHEFRDFCEKLSTELRKSHPMFLEKNTPNDQEIMNILLRFRSEKSLDDQAWQDMLAYLVWLRHEQGGMELSWAEERAQDMAWRARLRNKLRFLGLAWMVKNDDELHERVLSTRIFLRATEIGEDLMQK